MSSEPKETGRLEAFSDGVFAFAITLLVLNLRVPTPDSLSQMSLFQFLLGQWQSLFALITSFATILIMWVNHHNMFTRIQRVDTTFLFLNGLLLFFIVLTPFTTQLVATYVGLNQTANGRTAAAFYSGVFLLLGIAWTAAGRYTFTKGLAVREEQRVERRILIGPIFYAVAFGLSFVSGFASLIVILIIAGFFTIYAREIWRVTTGVEIG